MAKFDCCMRCSGRQTSRPLQLPTWKRTLARAMSLPKQTQRLGDDLGAFVPVWSSIHHKSCRITRFLLRFCVSIQGHSWRFTLFIFVSSVNKSANVRFPPCYVSICDGPCDFLHAVLRERRQNQVGSFN